MKKELIINSDGNKLKIAFLEDSSIIEYYVDDRTAKINIGDVYLGEVRSVSSVMNAAFINIKEERDAFLHYSNLGAYFSNFKNFIEKTNKEINLRNLKLNSPAKRSLTQEVDKLGLIDEIISPGEVLLVQVKKEPICTKGARVSCDITLAGRFLILIPFGKDINISKKISSVEERNRLKILVESMIPNNFGVVIRTVAEGKDASELLSDIKSLLKKWNDGIKKLASASCNEKIIYEINRTSAIIRDMLSPDFDQIVVNDPIIFDEIKDSVKKIAPEKINIVKLDNSSIPIFEKYKVEKQIKSLFGKIVSLEGGGYLIIEKTEAMHVIDVNSGSKISKTEDQEDSILKINLAAAKEVSRQLRLRDLGGIIIVDFIDMKKSEHRTTLQNSLNEYLNNSDNKAKVKVLPISKFGLIQITRQRVRSEIQIDTSEKCSACDGKGKTKSILTVVDDIEKKVDFLAKIQNEKSFFIYAHPYIFSYFSKGIWPIKWKWIFKYKTIIKIKPMDSFAINEYKFFTSNEEEIEMNKPDSET